MALAAVYARKSTEQNVADDEKSVRRQVDLAVGCAKEHGFTVPAEHIYVDDAISGAEFDRRPGLMRLLNTIGRRAPFAALFLADKDRLGREQFETNHILKQISLAGAERGPRGPSREPDGQAHHVGLELRRRAGTRKSQSADSRRAPAQGAARIRLRRCRLRVLERPRAR